MCGICGVLHRDGRAVNPDVLIRMNDTLLHRGPDEEGYVLNDGKAARSRERLQEQQGAEVRGNVGLGHRRLSIIDLASGQQPLSNEDDTVWVVLNGEIYNFRDLTRELEGRGHRFRTRSDTEVIVHAYEEWGERAVERFRGMFAFALWDEGRRRMVLARDRVGKKPLYYWDSRDAFVFGSEIKAILSFPGVPRETDLTAISDYLSLIYVPSPKTAFKAIRKLPPAHVAVIDVRGTDVRPYWDLSFRPHHEATEERIMEELIAILEEATRIRMISEVPLGSFLSGGVDSSAVVAFMARASGEPIKTSSISFSEAAYNEIEYARQVAELFHTDHHEFHVTPKAVSVIEKLAWHYDEPFADSSAVPTYYVSKTAREHVTVALSGDGGDENFAGYRRYAFDLRENAVRDLVPALFRQPFFAGLGRLYPKGDYLPQLFRGKAFLSNVARDPVEAYFHSVSASDDNRKLRLLNGDVLKSLNGYRTSDLFREIYERAPAEDHLSKIQYLDIKTYLCEDILTKVDRASMAVSLEVRCPLLDHVFMEYVARIPGGLKLNKGGGKHILKKALEPYLPAEILQRRKRGFAVPVLEWLRGSLAEYGRDLVLSGQPSRLYFEKDTLETMWKEHQRGIRNWSTDLWAIMMLNLWHERFLS